MHIVFITLPIDHSLVNKFIYLITQRNPNLSFYILVFIELFSSAIFNTFPIFFSISIVDPIFFLFDTHDIIQLSYSFYNGSYFTCNFYFSIVFETVRCSNHYFTTSFLFYPIDLSSLLPNYYRNETLQH